MRFVRGIALRALFACSAWALGVNAHEQSRETNSPEFKGECVNGAQVRYERYCRFFVRYNTEDGPLPTMVADFLRVTKSSETRSIGLIIAIDQYPGMDGKNLSAAAVDAIRLQNFLIDDQRFDEVIVLRNADATVQNINYFLEDYLPGHASDYRGADGQGKARLLIAYSGHGRPQTPDMQAAFVLSSATDPDGSDGIYKMKDFTRDVENLAAQYFHVLTLINACFGANLFTEGNRGSGTTPSAPGSFAITAGSPLNEVQALIPSRGSLFFDLVVNATTTGEADPQSLQYYSSDINGVARSQGVLTRSIELIPYLSAAFYRINAVQKRANPNFQTISEPYFGAVQPGMAQGGFFFFADKPASHQESSLAPYLKPLDPDSIIQTASVDPTSMHIPRDVGREICVRWLGACFPLPGVERLTREQAIFLPLPSSVSGPNHRDDANLPVGPISSIKGRPDIKIFKAPVIYPIWGYDLSSADGTIDWAAFAKAPRPTFIYARALGWAGPDKTFADRWLHAKAMGVDRGAYIKLNYCMPIEEQIDQLSNVAEPTDESLPVAIELVTPTADEPYGATQLACYQRLGDAEIRDRILQLAKGIREMFGKTPLLFGNSYNLSVLTDERSNEYMLWINAYGPQSTMTEKLRLRGNNPWTMWQYSAELSVVGIGSKTTGEVFFGTPAQYDLFKRGATNVALEAVR